MSKKIWIAWETQRRSVELAKYFNCELFILDFPGAFRYPKCIIKTISILLRQNPQILFVQNPSMILASLVCFYRFFSKLTVVVDRHTTFLLSKKYKDRPWLLYTPRLLIFRALHLFTIKFSDLTIVTNRHLASLVNRLGGQSFVLPDKVPTLIPERKIELKGSKNVLLISSFGKDEPIQEVLSAMKLVPDNVVLYITGNYKKRPDLFTENLLENTILTGFIPEEEFTSMLFSVDLAIALTTSEHCMLCGCYEVVSAEIPLVTSKKDVLVDYFKGAVFVENTSKSIAGGILEILNNYLSYKKQISALKIDITASWEKDACELVDLIDSISTKRLS